MAAYKPGPHLRYLVEKMAESELGIHEVLTKVGFAIGIYRAQG
jgi:hypothetical protein